MNTVTLQHAVLALIAAVAIVTVVRWELFLVRDISASTEVRCLSKSAWTVICLIVIPVGGILYLFCGRTR